MLKALLVLAGRRFRYIHDLAELADECAKVWPDLAVDFAEVIPLSKWATAYRYPGLEEAFDQPPKPEHIEQVLERLLLLRAKCDSVVAATRSSPRQAPELAGTLFPRW